MSINIRLVTQKNKWYCGPASVKMVLDYYGIIKSQEEIGAIFCATEKDGCDIVANINLFNRLDLDAEYFKNSSLEVVNQYLLQGIHPILYWNRRNTGHYSVFSKIENGRVFVADPGNLSRIVSFTKQRFLERWKDPENPIDKREIIVIKKRG